MNKFNKYKRYEGPDKYFEKKLKLKKEIMRKLGE
jgi:hypothetical protein